MENRIQLLLIKLRNNTLDNNDWDELLALLDEENKSAEVANVIAEMLASETSTDQVDVSLIEGIEERIRELRERRDITPKIKRGTIFQMWKAAAMVIIIGGGVFFYRVLSNPSKVDTEVVEVTGKGEDFLPAQKGAILRLANGEELLLDNLQQGSGVNLAHVVDMKIDDGELTYKSQVALDTLAYNMLITPKGRQFSVVLADGTRAWLNANSSLYYPIAFGKNAREVKASGEVYFEVVPDKKRPFNVDVDGKMLIEVLGTHFNVSAYQNEAAISTTLLEGSVLLKSVDVESDRQLNPGQQGVLNKADPSIIYVKSKVDIERVMAWKNGKFDFDGLKVEDAMRMIERWYDITVKYQGGVPEITFYGELNRDLTLSDLLSALKDSKLRFKMDGRTLLILK